MEGTDLLLIEDNPDDVELTLHAFRKNNLANHIEIVRDGAEALEFFFGENPPDNMPRLILLDLKLPKVNGLEVLEKLKSHPKTKQIPIVILTSSEQDPDIKRCYELGANSYIVKPVEFEEFVDSVGALGFYWLLLNKPPQET